MLWAILAVIGAAIWAVGNIIEKVIIDKYIRSPALFTIFIGIFAGLAALVVSLVFPVTMLSSKLLLICFVSAALYILAGFFYMKSIAIEEVSRVVPLFALAPIFVLIFATIFLGELFAPSKYIGIFLIVFGAVMISYKKTAKFRLNEVFWLMLISTLAYAGTFIPLKYVLQHASFYTTFFWIGIFSFVVILPLLFINMRRLVRIFRANPRSALYISISESIDMGGRFFFFASASLAAISLVAALVETQPIFVLCYALMLSIFFPWILKEELRRSRIILKIVSIAIIVMGAILLI